MPYPLTLRANVDGWRLFLNRKAHERFKAGASKIFQRDHYRCQFCGFQSKKFQEIINLDGNYRNNIPSNLATACSLCAHCQFLGVPGLGHRIILLPEMKQTQLSHFLRTLFCAMESQSEVSETAKVMYRNLFKYTEPIEKSFGKDASEFEVFGQALLDTPELDDAKYQGLSDYVRVLPSAKPFAEQIRYWSRSVMPDILITDGGI